MAAPTGGASSGAVVAVAPVIKEKEEPKDESDDNMGFNLFH